MALNEAYLVHNTRSAARTWAGLEMKSLLRPEFKDECMAAAVKLSSIISPTELHVADSIYKALCEQFAAPEAAKQFAAVCATIFPFSKVFSTA